MNQSCRTEVQSRGQGPRGQRPGNRQHSAGGFQLYAVSCSHESFRQTRSHRSQRDRGRLHGTVARARDSVIRATLGIESRVVDLRFAICNGQVIVDDDAGGASGRCGA